MKMKKIGRNPKCDRDRIEKELNKNWKVQVENEIQVKIEKGYKSPNRNCKK